MRFFAPFLLVVALSACSMPTDPSQVAGSPDPNASAMPSASPSPVTFTGTGATGAQGPFTLSVGTHKFTANFNGSAGGNFIVELDDASGNMVDMPFNKIGSFSGSYTEINQTAGQYYLKVSIADGSWSLGVDTPAPALASPAPSASP